MNDAISYSQSIRRANENSMTHEKQNRKGRKRRHEIERKIVREWDTKKKAVETSRVIRLRRAPKVIHREELGV